MFWGAGGAVFRAGFRQCFGRCLDGLRRAGMTWVANAATRALAKSTLKPMTNPYGKGKGPRVERPYGNRRGKCEPCGERREGRGERCDAAVP